MKKMISFVFFLYSTTVFGQQFRFVYTTIGLGSNRGDDPSLVVRISDSVLTYQLIEQTSEFKVDPEIKDTLWTRKPVRYEVPFRKSSRDSILSLLKGKEGKYFFATNYHVMSGSIQQFYFEHKDWCVEYCLKNTFDSTAMHVVKIVNQYLPKNEPIYIPYELWTDRSHMPFTKTCPSDPDTKYTDILEEEYEYIRMKK